MAEKNEVALPLVVEGLTFRHRARPEPVLRDISFTLERGKRGLCALVSSWLLFLFIVQESH